VRPLPWCRDRRRRCLRRSAADDGTRGTGRNWNTVLKIAAAAADLAL